jgi:uncharacterized repeat protein (TIGR02543 family)
MPTTIYDSSLITQRSRDKVIAQRIKQDTDSGKPIIVPQAGYASYLLGEADNGNITYFRQVDGCTNIDLSCNCTGYTAATTSSGSGPAPGPGPSVTYTLTYNAGAGGSGTAPAPTTSYSGGTGVQILGNTFISLLGYTFGGWNTIINGTGIYYPPPPGSTLTMPYANTILYAQWYNPAGTNYQVIYNGNGSSSGTAPETANYKNFQGVGPIPGNTGSLTNGSLTFYGWNTAANGLGIAYPSASNGFTMPAANVTLYAQWVNTSTQYTLTYDGNGSTGGSVPASPTQYPDGAGVGVLGQSSLVKSGYTFLGWNTASDGTGINYLTGQSIVMNSNKSLYAQWVGGSVAKSCGTGTGGSGEANIYNSTSRTAYRDTTNNTITIIIPTYFSTTNGGPYGTGDGPNASPPSTSYGNLLSTSATAIISESSPGSYQISVTYTTIWTGGSQVQTATLPLSPTYWPLGQTISGITIPTDGPQPASFIFDTTATPSFNVLAGGCYNSIVTSNIDSTVNATYAGIIAFYINFTDGTTTRVAVGTEFRWVTQSTAPRTYTYTSNYARIEVANGSTPGPLTVGPIVYPYAGTFTPTASTEVSSS